MAASIASQLKAIKSQLKGSADPIRRPLTRPSVLFDPKEAADIDLRTILPIAISGLDVLIGLDSRFGSYRDTLFSNTSLDVDREKMVPKEEGKLNKSVCSFLRLLAGYLQLPAALKTLEYLIRRYQVHVFNVDELVLCALPYHDTHAFVRIVQLIDLGNKKWGFLEGAKVAGAPPPRKVIVQQCIRDKGVLEALCNYALPTKEFGHSRPVICFCTAVIVEALGSVQKLDDETVKRVLPFVFSGLNPAMKGGQDAKAGALMVVGLLAGRATLASKLVHNLISFIVRVAQQDAKESADLPWLRVTLMALITLVQSQSVHVFPKKSLKILIETRDLSGILAGLSQDFKIEKFLSLYLQTLADYSSSDAVCCSTLITALDVIPVKNLIGNVVSNLLGSFVKSSPNMESSSLHEAGSWAKQIFNVIDKNYPSELCAAIQCFLQNSKQYSMEEEAMLKTLCLLFDGSLEMPFDISNSKVWFSLEHPKAEVRKATLSHLSSSGLLKAESLHPRLLVIVQVSILRQLVDDDLTVVQAALSIDGLCELINPSTLLKALQDILSRCIHILKTGTSNIKASCEVAVLCLNSAVKLNLLREVAMMIFPYLIVLPKTWRINLRALELAKELHWPLYSNSFSSFQIPPDEPAKILEHGYITSFNLKIVGALAESFVGNPGEYMEWLIECSKSSECSKSLFLSIVLQAILSHKGDVRRLLKLFEACFPLLKNELLDMESEGNSVIAEEFTAAKLDSSSVGCMELLVNSNFKAFNANTIACACWAFLKAFASEAMNNSQVDDSKNLVILEDLFVFFTTSSLKDFFMEHRRFLLSKCCTYPVQFLSRFFTKEGFPVAVQVESLLSFATVCSTVAPGDINTMSTNLFLELLVGFPSLIVPLSSKRKDMRMAAMDCIEGLYKLWHQFDFSRVKNGNDTLLIRCVSTPTFGKLLGLINGQKKLILSDADFLPSLLTSMLGQVSDGLVVPQNIEKRFDQQAKDTILLVILNSVLKLSSHAKLTVLSLFKGIGYSILKIDGVKSLLSELSDRRRQHFGHTENSCQRLSEIEIEILCCLLEMSALVTGSINVGTYCIDHLIQALRVDVSSLEDPAVVKPCVTALQNVTGTLYNSLKTELQDGIFGNLVYLFQNDNSDIRMAAKEALSRINVGHMSVVKLLEMILSKGCETGSSIRMKRKKISGNQSLFFDDTLISGETVLPYLNSLLDILLLKKDMKNRKSLVEPLLQLLEELISKEWLHKVIGHVEESKVSLEIPQTVINAITYAQQATLMILEDISNTLISDPSVKGELFNKHNINLLVKCARSTEIAVTCNHVFLLLSAAAKVSPGWVSECILDLFTVIAEAAIKQNDSHSQHVLENLISTLVPCWLSQTDGMKNLLQVFMNVLPQIAEHRRLTLMVYLLRTLGEKNSLATFLAILFRSLTLRKSKSSEWEKSMNGLSFSTSYNSEWEYLFAVEICDQFPCRMWLPSLVLLLEEIGMDSQDEEYSYEILLVLHFIMQKLRDTEFSFELESGKEMTYLQCTLGAILEKVVLQVQLTNTRRMRLHCPTGLKKQLKESEHTLLKTIANIMVPSEYFKAITRLLDHADVNVRKKALRFLAETLKNPEFVKRKQKEKSKQLNMRSLVHMDESTKESFSEMCFKVIQLVDDCIDDSLTSLKMVAISCLESLASKFPSNDIIFMASLTSVVKLVPSIDLSVSSSCLRCVSALIKVLGSKALPELPNVMNNMLKRAQGDRHAEALDAPSSSKLPLSLSVLVTLEAIVENLSCFLSPYLEDIIKLLVLHPDYISELDPRIKSKAGIVRKLVTEKIHVRLSLTPLLKIYPEAVKHGDASLSIAFEMLTSAVGAMDRSSVGSYHLKISEQCLLALDLRYQHPESVKNIKVVEQNVIHAIVVLTLKLTETMFRPLFLRTLEWAESELEIRDSTVNKSIERAISFYNLVNKLAEQHRSLFVLYFKYLLDGCVQYLSEDQYTDSASLTHKRKKAKVGETCTSKEKGQLSPKLWHLRALILSALHKCFLYDTGNLKFLDSSNFQVLLKPIASQLTAEPPALLGDLSELPTVEEVDESLVCCLGQMAVTVGSDDIWKQLNHEVLMQTRSEKARPRILGLKVVKYLMEHLKEEYLVLLPETIPFLGELLEDVELPIKSLAQEIFKDLETLSGENLRQYL